MVMMKMACDLELCSFMSVALKQMKTIYYADIIHETS